MVPNLLWRIGDDFFMHMSVSSKVIGKSFATQFNHNQRNFVEMNMSHVCFSL